MDEVKTQNQASLTKKEKRDLKRLNKQEEQKRKGHRQKIQHILKLTAIISIPAIAIGIILLLLSQKQPPGSDYSQEIPSEGQLHVSEGTKVNYSSNPPVSGSHWPSPLKDGLYETEKPDEALVHSLEHGRIWISYKPSISEQIKKDLKDLLKKQSAVILTARSANETDIALASWGRVDTFNLDERGTFDQKRILDFIKRYKNKGPEFVPGHTGAKTYD